ncbi:myosin light chain kinase A-like [Babylonia areolata]|uniref:myosin light chain kinase A-like n=1 Tax=Babylonia areolata TaxID=304850 RepID=UPI003FD0B82F
MSTGPTTARKGSAEKSIPHTRIQDDAMIRDNYEVGEKIGQGNFGKVYEATHKATDVKWAIKSINKDKAGTSNLKLVEREVSILKRVNHPNIINLNEVIESPKRMYLVMEICTQGELADRLKENKLFSEAETKQIMVELAGAISYLHKHGIVHRDLKLENILLGENPEDPSDKLFIKVTDFGLSVVKGGVTPDNMMQDFCGTPIYMAPEILDNKTYSQQCDVWAMGIIMYTLICGYPPFRAKDEASLYDLIREANVQYDDQVWPSISEECKNCILGMLKVDPAHRLSAAEVLNHPWITGEARDTNQPANVLEMMKMWKDELRNDLDNPSNEQDDRVDSLECPNPPITLPTISTATTTTTTTSSESKGKVVGGGVHKKSLSQTASHSSSSSHKGSPSDHTFKRGRDSKSPTTGSRRSQNSGCSLPVPRNSSRSTTPSSSKTTTTTTTTGNGVNKAVSPVGASSSSSKSSLGSKTKKK